MKKIDEEIEKNGFAEVSLGLYLFSKDSIQAAQKHWEEEAAQKDFDFSNFRYWLTYAEMEKPEGFDSIRECLKYLREHGCTLCEF